MGVYVIAILTLWSKCGFRDTAQKKSLIEIIEEIINSKRHFLCIVNRKYIFPILKNRIVRRNEKNKILCLLEWAPEALI